MEEFEVDISGWNSRTFPETHPVIEGCAWYRGYGINVDEGQVLFLESWTMLGKGDAPDPVVYIRGAVSDKSVKEIVEKYHQGLFKDPKTSLSGFGQADEIPRWFNPWAAERLKDTET